MEYRRKDFERLLLNVYEVSSDENLFEVFPILNTYQIFHKDLGTPELNIQKVLRYIIYTFDQNSPLQAIPDMLERRIDAAFLAGFLDSGATNKFHARVEEMLVSKNFDVNLMIVQYCVLQNNDDYISMVALQDTLRRVALDMLNNDYEEKVQQVIKAMDDCRKSISSIRETLLTTSKDPFLNRSLYVFREASKLRLRPEDIAQMLMEHDPFFKSIRIS